MKMCHRRNKEEVTRVAEWQVTGWQTGHRKREVDEIEGWRHRGTEARRHGGIKTEALTYRHHANTIYFHEMSFDFK